MVVAHNLTAYNAQRQFNLINNSRSKSTEKLSSGYKINRAADDAAGLAISEKMRRQVRGLTQASFNCQDGIGLCQVRDGALNEVHDILNRMNVLSVQAANDTLMDEDRAQIQVEMDQLVSEINRIGSDTEFNNLKVFDYAKQMGMKPTPSSSAIGSGYLTDVYQEPGTNRYHPSANLNFGGINSETVSQLYDKSFSFTCSAGCSETFTFKFIDGDGTQNSLVGKNNGQAPHTYTIDIHGKTTANEVLDCLFGYVAGNMANDSYIASADGKKLPVSHSNTLVRTSDNSMTIAANATYSDPESAKHAYDAKIASHSPYSRAICTEIAGVIQDETFRPIIKIQAGAEKDQYIALTMDTMNARVLGVDPTDISTQSAAANAIQQIKNAFRIVSEQRSDAGAEQNRLEHAIKNLDNIVENTQAAESQIRDTDMAREMVQYSLKNILAQAGQSMMTQANQSNQGVLSLLS